MARNWTRDELFVALRLYFETPFGRLHSRNPDVVALAERLQRTPSSVAMKPVNFASLDPAIRRSGRSGLSGASRADRAAWDDFTGNWEAAVAATGPEVPAPDRMTETEEHHVRRIGQDFFRRAVLSRFESKCCATGISEVRLLIASHIVPWAQDTANRLNPANGLCLAATHDRAFDAGLITVDPSMRWLVSRDLLAGNAQTRAAFAPLSGMPLRIPPRLDLAADLLARHREAATSRHDYR